MTQRNEKFTIGSILALIVVLMGFTATQAYHAVSQASHAVLRAADAEEAACKVSRTLGEHMARQEEREKYMMETLERIEVNVKALRGENK